MRHHKLVDFIRENKKQLEKIGINIQFNDDSSGDNYYSEHYYLFNFEIFGNKYSVGSVSITEDSDDWAQAECHSYDICDENDRQIEPEKVFNILDNFIQINRDNKIDKILDL